LDISVEESLKRRHNQKKDRMESEGAKFLKRVSDGFQLIAKDQNLVIELDSNRQEVFRMRVEGVLSAEKTAEGNYLLFSYSGQWLREYSPEKKINWELKGVKFNNAMPLANGNVLVTVGSASIVREIDPKSQNTVWEFNPGWWPNDAYRLDNGNTLVGGKGGVLEVTPSREIVWEYGNPESATIVVAKPTGKETVLVGWTSGQAREINVEKETVWEYKMKSLCDVFRDPGGNTLFAGATEFLEIDPSKTIVWRLPKQAKTATIRR
ncbi:MAG: hypothetical protein VX438_03455, partial [Planctomycetota bacterium]|nr:hypothetical protein [Planctomycetota bacterium]